jgi:hypothetical protein
VARPASTAVADGAGSRAIGGRRRSWLLRLTALACGLALAWGLYQRSDSDLTPRTGLGYALGITGLAQMVLLLTYSARKRLRWLRGVGAIHRWFEFHMMCGLAAPTALLLHCNFELGSLNSAVSLFCTLFVAGSGIVGRFLYARIHRGLLGERRSLSAERAALRRSSPALTRACEAVAPLGEALERFEDIALAPGSGPRLTVRLLLRLPIRARKLRRATRLAFDRRLPEAQRSAALGAVDEYLRSVRRTAVLALYEWMFGLWHAIHLPLSAVVFLSAGIHVVAVHMF